MAELRAFRNKRFPRQPHFYLFIKNKKKKKTTAQTWLELDGLSAASVSIVTHHVLFGSARDTMKREKLQIAFADDSTGFGASLFFSPTSLGRLQINAKRGDVEGSTLGGIGRKLAPRVLKEYQHSSRQ